MAVDADGNYWELKEIFEMPDDPITDEELAADDAEMRAWEESPEGQAFKAEWAAGEAERQAKYNDPNRLSNRVDSKDFPLLFAQAVQAIFDETGKPCHMQAAGVRAGMDEGEYLVACVYASQQGLIRHPEKQGRDTSGLCGTFVGVHLWEPAVG